jgi:alkaline phosphatase D
MRAFFGIIAVLTFIHCPAGAQQKYSILQGTTSDTVTHFTVVAPSSDNLRFEVIGDTQRNLDSPMKSERVSHPNSPWVVYRLKFEGLNPNARYVLRTIDVDNHVVDQRNFKTLETRGAQGRIALVSCMLRQIHNPFLWKNLALPQNRPDLMMFLGDSVYLDRSRLLSTKLPKSSLEVWQSFVLSRNRLGVYFWRDLVPILSVWDDHDSGGDNVDPKSFPFMAQVRQVYETFFANEPIEGRINAGPGMAKQFEAFGKNFLMLDGRSFRGLDPESPMFGKEQESWLAERVQPGGNIILNGSQFFGKHLRKDSLEYNWPAYAPEFNHRLRAIGEAKDASFVFASGDIHFSQIQHLEPEILGYPTVEITSSSAHSMIFPGYHRALHWFRPNPRHSSGVSTHNVVLLEMNSSVQSLDFEVRSLTWRGKTAFAESVSVGGPCERLLNAAKPIR